MSRPLQKVYTLYPIDFKQEVNYFCAGVKAHSLYVA